MIKEDLLSDHGRVDRFDVVLIQIRTIYYYYKIIIH